MEFLVTFDAGDLNGEVASMLLTLWKGRVQTNPNSVEVYPTSEDDYNKVRELVNAYTHEDTIKHYAIFLHEHESSAPTDNVNHPSHYNRGGIECIDAMIAAKGIEKVKIFCECNDFKYDWRRGEKDPILQDARKSRWYLDKFIELEEKHPTEIIEVDGHKYLRID